MAKIYFIDDWAIMLGPVFAETPFNYAHKRTVVILSTILKGMTDFSTTLKLNKSKHCQSGGGKSTG